MDILGCLVDRVDRREALERIEQLITAHRPSQVITLNAEMVYQAQKDKDLQRLINSAELVTPDGIGIIWGARHMGFAFPERVTGIDLMLSLCQKAAEKSWTVFLFGAAPGVAEQAARVLQAQFSGLKVCGTRHGYFSEADHNEIVEQVTKAGPDILFVALGAPKQEYWIERYNHQLQVPVCIGVGGSFDVVSGVKKRAPGWAIKLNIEWLYRLLAEPSRWKRQLALPRFVLAVLRSGKK